MTGSSRGPRLKVVVASYVQVVSEDTQREDGHGERVASKARVTTEKLRDDLVVIF